MRHFTMENYLRNVSLSDLVVVKTSQTYMEQSTTHLGHMVQPTAPGLQAGIALYCTIDHKIKSSTREK